MEKLGAYDAIRDELVEMARLDQAMRNGSVQTGEWDDSVDAKNTQRLKEIVAGVGWPRISQVGLEAAQDAWLLVQHADRDVAFQQQCLERMKQLPPDEFRPSNLAYLEDRVRVNTGKPQLYGTQFFGTGDDFGPRPIEDAGRLD